MADERADEIEITESAEAIVADGPPAPVSSIVIVVKRPHEHWAEEAGMLPALRDVGAFGGRLNPKFPAYAAGRAFRNWPEGFEVTRDEFEQAIAEAGAQPIR